MNGLDLALQLLPSRCRERGCREMIAEAEELRLRRGQALTALCRGREYPLPGGPVGEGELLRCLEKATGASLHSAAEAMSRGYVCYHGLRIGICGTAVLKDGQLTGFRALSSLVIRIPRECRGICEPILADLRRNGFGNILILSPPGGGKTTALRELVRGLSTAGWRIALADERCEVAAAESGCAAYDLGPYTDVLSGVSKQEASLMLLRGMNPQIIAMDEITQAEDLLQIREIVGCGVRLIATAHARDPEDLRRRPLYRTLAEEGIFSERIVIRCGADGRSYELSRADA